MPLIHRLVRTFPEAIADEPGVVLSDGDGTLLHPRSLTFYEEVPEILAKLVARQFTLVTANPDPYLAADRKDALQSLLPRTTQASVVYSNRAIWLKLGLYARAFQESAGDSQSATVIGNRWLMDEVVGRFAVRACNPLAQVTSYCIRRSDDKGDVITDPIVRKAEHLGYSAMPRVMKRIIVGEYMS